MEQWNLRICFKLSLDLKSLQLWPDCHKLCFWLASLHALDSFKVLLTETVGQIKRANEYLPEQQMKEINKLKYNEPRKFKKKANEN